MSSFQFDLHLNCSSSTVLAILYMEDFCGRFCVFCAAFWLPGHQCSSDGNISSLYVVCIVFGAASTVSYGDDLGAYC